MFDGASNLAAYIAVAQRSSVERSMELPGYVVYMEDTKGKCGKYHIVGLLLTPCMLDSRELRK